MLSHIPSGAPTRLSTYSANSSKPSIKQISSVSWTKDGALIVGGNAGSVTLLGSSFQSVYKGKCGAYIDSVTEFDDGYLVMTATISQSNLQPMTRKLEPRGAGFATTPAQPFCHMSLSTSNIVVVNQKKNCIDVYDRMTFKKLKYISTDLANLRGIHALDDNTVVVTDNNNSLVCLYNLKTGKRVWTFSGIKNPTGVTSDSSGFIYVAAVNPKEICILSPGGKSVDIYITCLISCLIWVACSVF